MLAAAPQLLDHPVDVIVRSLPWWFFMAVHIAIRAFEAAEAGFGWAFTLFALAEISYMTYHVNITNFLFAHTISEVLDGVAFVIIFATTVQKGITTVSGKQSVGAAR
jgi:hypothetical protein